MNGFTRQEAIALTGVKSGNLSYMDRTGLVVPSKYGNPQRPTVIYSAEQILQLKIAETLRDRFSLQQIRKVVSAINADTITKDADRLMLINHEVYLLNTPIKLGETLIALLPLCPEGVPVQEIGSIKGAIAELREAGSKVLDFEKRIQGTILDRASNTP